MSVPVHRFNAIVDAMARNDIAGAQTRTDSLVAAHPLDEAEIRMTIVVMWTDHITTTCPHPEAHIVLDNNEEP